MEDQRADNVVTMVDVHAQAVALAAEARETFPGAVDCCTYYRGPLRQNVWSCRDCGDKGVCYACSISCHADHELVELWPRREFTCDCTTIPASAGSSKTICTLNGRHRAVDPPNDGNRYMRNFRGEFCRCPSGLRYDPLNETQGMICCLACEDWFHESCLNLRPPINVAADTSNAQAKDSGREDDDEDDDEEGIRIKSSSYDALICAQCVRSNTLLSSLAGTAGWMMLLPPGTEAEQANVLEDGWRLLGYQDEERKRSLTEGGQERAPKRIKVDLDAATGPAVEVEPLSGCTRPQANPIAQARLADPDAQVDVFVAYGARDGLCQCKDCMPEIQALPFPLQDAEIYEPPRDDSPDDDLDETTSRLLDTLPRSQAISAVMGFLPIKERLDVLFGERRASGLPVTKEDIDRVFEQLKKENARA